MEYLIQYGMFLAKAATIVVAIVLVIGAIAATGSRQRRASKRGEIVIERLNDHLEDLHDAVREEVIDPATLKLDNKARSKREKEEAKAETKRAKAEAKDKAKEKAKEKAKPKGESSQGANAAISENKSSNDARLDDAPSRRKRIYVLDFDGDVAAEEVSSLREEITTVLSIAEPCDEIILKLESPGGMVHAYGLAASQLQRIKDAKIPLTICVDKVAASGGYMMACLADKLVAAPFAIIGSIGVVVQLPNFHKILKKNEVDYEVISAGEYKRTLSTFGEITDKGRAKVQEDVENIHEIFKQWVKSHRPIVDVSRVATGETWVGMQAKERYLVDELNTSDDVLVRACKDADVFEVNYKFKQTLQDKLGAAVEAGVARAANKLLAADRSKDFQ
ncbi:protease SohB [Gammaproteobacteria bacterium]|nr:protease SohB [Gammaproteobacteria bacterium]MDB4003990.1 protease SohB [Gammaproteobacteria bacterium]